MCLYFPKRIEPNKDIVCYKVLNSKFQSAVYKFQYRIGKTYSLDSELKVEKDSLQTVSMYFSSVDTISEGFHSYIKRPLPHSFCRIVKCLIPKDAEVYEGTNGGGIECYVSNKIKILEEI